MFLEKWMCEIPRKKIGHQRKIVLVRPPGDWGNGKFGKSCLRYIFVNIDIPESAYTNINMISVTKKIVC